MQYNIKGLKIGSVIITTKHQLENCAINMEAKEVWDLFIRAIKEGKIKSDK